MVRLVTAIVRDRGVGVGYWGVRDRGVNISYSMQKKSSKSDMVKYLRSFTRILNLSHHESNLNKMKTLHSSICQHNRQERPQNIVTHSTQQNCLPVGTKS